MALRSEGRAPPGLPQVRYQGCEACKGQRKCATCMCLLWGAARLQLPFRGRVLLLWKGRGAEVAERDWDNIPKLGMGTRALVSLPLLRAIPKEVISRGAARHSLCSHAVPVGASDVPRGPLEDSRVRSWQGQGAKSRHLPFFGTVWVLNL